VQPVAAALNLRAFQLKVWLTVIFSVAAVLALLGFAGAHYYKAAKATADVVSVKVEPVEAGDLVEVVAAPTRRFPWMPRRSSTPAPIRQCSPTTSTRSA
jgi:hypothetical protein